MKTPNKAVKFAPYGRRTLAPLGTFVMKSELLILIPFLASLVYIAFHLMQSRPSLYVREKLGSVSFGSSMEYIRISPAVIAEDKTGKLYKGIYVYAMKTFPKGPGDLVGTFFISQERIENTISILDTGSSGNIYWGKNKDINFQLSPSRDMIKVTFRRLRFLKVSFLATVQEEQVQRLVNALKKLEKSPSIGDIHA